MASIFTKIIMGEIPCYKIAEDDNNIAILDVFPVGRGHVLVIPKQEVDNIFDLPDDAYADLYLFAKKIAKALAKAIPCKKVGMTVIGLEVAHAHIHLIPMQKESDLLDFSKKKKLEPDEFEEIQQEIKKYL
ncbi:MAG: HIT family protein [Bacteroidales bacterium]